MQVQRLLEERFGWVTYRRMSNDAPQ